MTQMINYADTYCDSPYYQEGLQRAPVSDDAHFVSRIISAGACTPLTQLYNMDYLAYNGFLHNGTRYNLLCVERPNNPSTPACTTGERLGLYEFLQSQHWRIFLAPFSVRDVRIGCAVFGDPIGTTRGPWSHVAFAVGDAGIIATHTSDHCSITATNVFQALQAMVCQPLECVSNTTTAPMPTTTPSSTTTPTTLVAPFRLQPWTSRGVL